MIFTNTISFLALMATGAIATLPAKPDWLVEIRTGNAMSMLSYATMYPVVSSQLSDEYSCAISVSGNVPEGKPQFLNPVMNVTGPGYPGDMTPCGVGSHVAGEVPGFGRFSITFLDSQNGTCDGVTDSCRPFMRFEGEGIPMWKFDGNCEHTVVPPMPPYNYDLYQCGFITGN